MTAPRQPHPATLPELAPDLLARVAAYVRPHMKHLREDHDDDGLQRALGAVALVQMMSDATGADLDVEQAVSLYYVRHGDGPDLDGLGLDVLEELGS